MRPRRSRFIGRLFLCGAALAAVCGCSDMQGSAEDGSPSAAKSPSSTPLVKSKTATDKSSAITNRKAGGHRFDTRNKVQEKPAIPVPEGEDLPPAVMPKVVMSQSHAATCLVKVGDVMPDLSLTTLEGQRAGLSSLLGKKVTVVYFWRADHVDARQQLRDVAPRWIAQFAPHGVRFIGVNVGDARDVAAREIEAAGAGHTDHPQFLDAEKTEFARVATERLPRTYVLDATGKILWLDIEYSLATRHDLREALRAALGS